MSGNTSGSSSSLSLQASALSSPSPATSTYLAALDAASHRHTTVVAVISALASLLACLILFLLAVLFWQRRRRRLHNMQQAAIRRMTIVEPHSRSPSPRARRMSLFGSGSMGMTNMNKKNDAAWTQIPELAYDRRWDRVERDRERAQAKIETRSMYSSKQSDAGDGDRMVLVDGKYVLALESDVGHS
ncbi:hypothetical protein DFH11DRAFT_741438 [Phellopilus nigrolimitatus]|nr:hypothetical protein DFH11DRAFT_741438 [Phellopilus nigrolimitatus]